MKKFYFYKKEDILKWCNNDENKARSIMRIIRCMNRKEERQMKLDNRRVFSLDSIRELIE